MQFDLYLPSLSSFYDDVYYDTYYDCLCAGWAFVAVYNTYYSHGLNLVFLNNLSFIEIDFVTYEYQNNVCRLYDYMLYIQSLLKYKSKLVFFYVENNYARYDFE